jgi:basic membrane protein A
MDVPLRVTAAALAGLLLVGCAAKAATQERVEVALVADQRGFGDRSYNDAAQRGLDRCAREGAVGVTAVASRSSDDYLSDLSFAATQNANEIIAVGGTMARAVHETAVRFPNAHVALIDGVADEPNVESVTFDRAQGGYLAGSLAALVSRRHQVAFLGGLPSPRLAEIATAFEAGARAADPRVRVASAYAGSFENTQRAAQAAAQVFRGGADVAYVVAGPAGLGAIAAARSRRGTYVIGADADQDGLAPGVVLTSVVEHVAAAVQRICEDAGAHKPVSGHVVLGLREGGIGLTDFRYSRAVVSPAVRQRMRDIEETLAAHEVAVRADPPRTPSAPR